MRIIVLIIVILTGMPVNAQMEPHAQASQVRSLMAEGRVNEAKTLLIKCSDEQNAECQFILAGWIERGDLFQKDLPTAKSLYEISYRNGFERAGREVLRLTREMLEPSHPVSASVSPDRLYGVVPNEILKGLVGQRYSEVAKYFIRPECREEAIGEFGVDQVCDAHIEVMGGVLSATLGLKSGLVEFIGLGPTNSVGGGDCSRFSRVIRRTFGRSQARESVSASSLAGRKVVRGEPSIRVEVWGVGRPRSSAFAPSAAYMDMSDIDDGACGFFAFRPGMLDYFLSNADLLRR